MCGNMLPPGSWNGKASAADIAIYSNEEHQATLLAALFLPLPARDQKILHNFFLRVLSVHQGKHGCQLAAMMGIMIRDMRDHLPKRQGEGLALRVGVRHVLLQRSFRLRGKKVEHALFHSLPKIAYRGGRWEILHLKKLDRTF